MSIVKINKDDVEIFSVHTNPKRYFSSSSLGVTGSLFVFPYGSKIEKENQNSFFDSSFNELDINSTLSIAQKLGKHSSAQKNEKLFTLVSDYLEKVNSQNISNKNLKYIDIERFTPTTNFTQNTSKKLIVKDNLSKYYRDVYPSAHWGYTNFNSLNFQASNSFSTSSVLLYPNYENVYTPSGSFSFDFYINPRYRTKSEFEHFNAATILHLSSTYAISLITGSAKDENGLPSSFRLVLQLSHSADINPSLALPGVYPNDLIFFSNDNSLPFNKWSHVIIRWGTNTINQGTGSFVIDNSNKGNFTVPSSSINLSNAVTNPDVLCVGNYYVGNNSGTNALSYFFSNDVSIREGLKELNSSTGIDEPLQYQFTNKCNCEIQNLAIRKKYLNDLNIQLSSSKGPSHIDNDFAFFLPLFFIGTSPYRKFHNGRGGVPQTPFFTIDGTTTSPFNVAMSFGVNGHYINLENYLRDFANGIYPRLHNLSCSILENTTEAVETNEFLYNQISVSERNSLILPSDNSKLIPDYEILNNTNYSNLAYDDLKVKDLSFINLSNLIPSSSNLFSDGISENNTLMEDQTGYTPEKPGIRSGPAILSFIKKYVSGSSDVDQPYSPYTIFRRTNDPSSNAVTFFNISNLYYGKRIKPGSFSITDSFISGSGVKITLKDNGYGTLYRENSSDPGPQWASVGTIFYDEGIVAIKNPHLMFFGKNQFEISFRGEQNIHVQKFDIIAQANQINSSSNPNFTILSASNSITDVDNEFVYISSINFHDDNMNVIMRTNLAQPILKRHGEKIMFRIKYDW